MQAEEAVALDLSRYYWLIALVFVVGIVLVGFLKQLGPGGSSTKRSTEALPYRKTAALLSAAERRFFGVLERAVPGSVVLFAKVRMADLFDIAASGSERHAAFARISQKHADFVLADRETMEPLLVIELDDSSHQRERRRVRDEFVERIAREARLPLLRLPVRSGWDATVLRVEIDRALGRQAG